MNKKSLTNQSNNQVDDSIDGQVDDLVENKIKEIEKKKIEILALPSDKALNEILDYPQPAAIVHSFCEEDFYFLVHDIGTSDALPLICLSSTKQLEYLLDMELWYRDKIDISAITNWFNLFLEADTNRMMTWIINEKKDLFEYYLFRNIEVRIREHDEDPSDFGEGFVTIDNTIYVRFFDFSSSDKIEKNDDETRKELLSKMLTKLAQLDYNTYYDTMFSFSKIIPAEYEEEAYRQKNIRLAEKGFEPFEKAIGIYQPIEKEFFTKNKIKIINKNDNYDHLPVPITPIGMLKQDNIFARTLVKIDNDTILDQIKLEFTGLCNKIISADQNKIFGKEALNEVIEKVCGYLSIGLERLLENPLSENDDNIELSKLANFLVKYPLSNIFSFGYGMALKLKWKTDKWINKSWFKSQSLPLTFWLEEFAGVLGGLLLKKPLLFDNYESGVLFREFTTCLEIKNTESKLEDILLFDEIFSLLGINFSIPKIQTLNYKNFILTLWARHYIGSLDKVFQLKEFISLTLSEFKVFYNDLAENDDNNPNKPKRQIRINMKESFLNWICINLNIDKNACLKKYGNIFEDLFDDLEDEFEMISADNLDPRFIQLFFVR